MRETFGSGSNEDDSSEDQDKKKKSKKTKVAKRIPLAFSAEDSVEEKPKTPRLSIADRLFKQLDIRTSKIEDEISDDSRNDEGENNIRPDDEDIKHAETQENTGIDFITLASDWETDEDISLDDKKEADNKTRSDASSDKTKDEIIGDKDDAIEFDHAALNDVESITVEPELLRDGLESEEPDSRRKPEIDSEESKEERASDSRVYNEEPIIGTVRGTRREGPWFDAAEADRTRRAHESEINEVEYRAEKRGQSRGVTTGLFVGWLLGRRGKKKAEKLHQKEMKLIKQEIGKVKDEQAAVEQRLKAVSSAHEQIMNNPVVSERSRYEDSKTQKMEQKPVLAHEDLHISEKSTVAVNLTGEKQHINNYESNNMGKERLVKVSEKIKELNKLKEDLPIQAEDYEVEEGKRVETSAWHRIEVDEKTGRAIDNPELTYGEEFRREQKQEILTEVPDSGSSSGPSGLLGSLASSFNSGIDNNPHSPIPSYSHGTNKKNDINSEHHLSIGNELLKYTSRPIIWIVATAVVISLFLFGILS